MCFSYFRIVFWNVAFGILWISADVGAAFLDTGEIQLRLDLELLNESGAINIPTTTWPLSSGDVSAEIEAVDIVRLEDRELAALLRIKTLLASKSRPYSIHYSASIAGHPQELARFEIAPRYDGEMSLGLRWQVERVSANLQASYAHNPVGGNEIRPDESWVGATIGNWLLSAGWQSRWWGPGNDSSLILSNNAPPFPAVSIQRARSKSFSSMWLRWIGPWTASAFVGELDDERVISDTKIFGMRVAMRPSSRLEIGISRTAQWCGAARPCGGSTFVDLLLGRDNRGINVGVEEEPGNQLGGIDVRWRLPTQTPVAAYMQWIGEDTRRGGPEIGSWLRQVGLEYLGQPGSRLQKTYIEVSETSCRLGGAGFSELKSDCGYEHTIYRTGYRYQGRSIGHAIDSDGLSVAVGSNLAGTKNDRWSFLLRYSKLNGRGSSLIPHTLSTSPVDRSEIHVAYEKRLPLGQLTLGVGLVSTDPDWVAGDSPDVSAFVRWKGQ